MYFIPVIYYIIKFFIFLFLSISLIFIRINKSKILKNTMIKIYFFQNMKMPKKTLARAIKSAAKKYFIIKIYLNPVKIYRIFVFIQWC